MAEISEKYTVAPEKIRVKFRAQPRKSDYVREVDYETYKAYKQKLKQEQEQIK
jgi:hypothetical protein